MLLFENMLKAHKEGVWGKEDSHNQNNVHQHVNQESNETDLHPLPPQNLLL